jgi:hypothetical protein
LPSKCADTVLLALNSLARGSIDGRLGHDFGIGVDWTVNDLGSGHLETSALSFFNPVTQSGSKLDN